MRKTALILYNKISGDPKEDELDVLDEVKIVSEALKELKYKVLEYQISLNIDKAIKNIRKIKPDFIFNLTGHLKIQGFGDDVKYCNPELSIATYFTSCLSP